MAVLIPVLQNTANCASVLAAARDELAESFHLDVLKSLNRFSNRVSATGVGIVLDTSANAAESPPCGLTSARLILVEAVLRPGECRQAGGWYSVVPLTRVRSSLARCAVAATIETTLECVVRDVALSPAYRGATPLRAAICRAFDYSEPMAASVNALGRDTGVSRRRLEQLWAEHRERLAASTEATHLRDILTLARALRALLGLVREPNMTWSAVSQSLGTSGKTLRNSVQTATGRLPNEISMLELPVLVQAIETELRRVLAVSAPNSA